MPTEPGAPPLHADDPDRELELEPEEPGEEQELCVCCLYPNPTNASFCARCAAPVYSCAAMGPYERLLAECFIYRRAADRPHSLIVLLGIWLIFGTMAFTSAGLILLALQDDRSYLFSGVFMLFISVSMIWRTTESYLSRPPPAASADAAENEENL